MKPSHRTRRLARPAAAGLLTVGLFAGTAMPVHADSSGGLWYFDALNIQAVHDAGWTGAGVTIAVLDGPINPDIPTLRDADLQVYPEAWCHIDGQPSPPVITENSTGAMHATNIASYIVGTGAEGGAKGIAPDATLLHYTVASEEFMSLREEGGEVCLDAAGEPATQAYGDAINHAVDSGADIISLSIHWGLSFEADWAISRALGEGVIFVSGLSNRTQDNVWSDGAYDANGFVNVQKLDGSGNIPPAVGFLTGLESPNIDPKVDVAAPGVDLLAQGDHYGDWSRQHLATGTSYAAPIVAAMLGVVMQRYPEATSNQIIQSLIHNTGTGDHALTYDPDSGAGYGFASLTSMLRADPTRYPDVNPLFTPDDYPSQEDIELALESGGQIPDFSWEPAPVENPMTIWDVLIPLVFVPAAILVLLVVAIIVIVVVIRRRGRRNPPPPPAHSAPYGDPAGAPPHPAPQYAVPPRPAPVHPAPSPRPGTQPPPPSASQRAPQ